MTSPNRRLFDITGADAKAFLQGLVTNDVERTADGLVYAALLTPQGKFVADFFLSSSGEGYLLDVAEGIATSLVQRLNMYRLRADVTIAPSDRKVSCGLGPAPSGAFADPRHPALGWRSYGSDAQVEEANWDEIRVAHTIPETGIELTGDTYILEAGFERLNGVDFRKGCYVGQEIAARMKHKTELKKGLVTLEITGSAEVGAPITANGKPCGTLFTQAGGRAIAYLRFDRAVGTLEAGDAILSWDGSQPS